MNDLKLYSNSEQRDSIKGKLMKIRTKSIATITVLTLIVFITFYLFTTYSLNPSFDEVDKKEIESNIVQVTNAINDNLGSLEDLLVDYSSWDDTYDFAQNHNQAYIDINFVDGTFQNLHINLIATLDSNKNVLYSQMFDLDNSSKIATSIEVTHLIHSDSVFPLSSMNSTVSGLVLIGNQPMLIASAPILNSNYTGQPMGRMVFGQYLDNYQIIKLESILNFHFSIESINDFQQRNSQLIQTLQSNLYATIVEINDPETISGYILVNDIHSEPTFVLEATNQRLAYQEGQVIQTVFLGASLLLSVVIAIGSFFVIETSVVKPMRRLASTVKAMPLNAQHLEQAPKFGSEELSIISSAVKDTLDKKFEAMNDVSRMVAHDLRNPLAGIKSAAYVLSKNYSEKMDDKGKLMLKTINDCVEYSDKIVTDLLDFSTEIKPDKIEARAKELVDASLLQFNLHPSIEVVNETTDDFVVLVDREKIMRVFSNLIKNAFDAMPVGGKLVISNRQVRDYVVVEFTDSGTGMSKESLEKLWTPFFTTKAKGMGVGLPICKKIVEVHGGKIEVISTLNKGTTFSVYLPVKPNN
jgi:signal transduction histidine kinase